MSYKKGDEPAQVKILLAERKRIKAAIEFDDVFSPR
jgi:hypothetical protein